MYAAFRDGKYPQYSRQFTELLAKKKKSADQVFHWQYEYKNDVAPVGDFIAQ
jgi:hypothetical protein